MGKHLTALFLSLIVIFGFMAYGNSLSGKFIWDDDILVKNNVYIRSWADIGNIFANDISAGGGGEKSITYRPFQIFTYKIDYSFWKLNTVGYHFTNILLHILAALGVYWLIYIIFSDNVLSFLTSIFFIVHPVHAGTVAYISGRADSLSSLFILTALIYYIKNLHLERLSFYFLILLSYILALLSREGSLILPVLLLAYHYLFKVKIRGMVFPSLIAVTCFYIFFRVVFIKNALPDMAQFVPLLQRLSGFFVAVTHYFRLLLFPYGLHMEYGTKCFNFTDYKAIIGVVIFVAALTMAFQRRNRNRIFAFSIFWFFIGLLPVSNIYPINVYMAEHWLYLPSIGFFLLLANSLNFMINRAKRLPVFTLSRPKDCVLQGGEKLNLPEYSVSKSQGFSMKGFVLVFSLGLLIFYACLSLKQNQYWQDPISFYKQTLKYVPDSARLYFNLASLYKDKGRLEEAVVNYRKAAEFSRDKVIEYNAYNKLGDVYWNIGKSEEAIAAYKKAIGINPGYISGYNNLGIIYAMMDKKQEAVALFKKSLEIDNHSIEAFTNLGSIYAAMGKDEESASAYKKVLEFNPGYMFVINNLVNLYIKSGNLQDLIADYEKKIKDAPNNFGAYYTLGNIYALVNKKGEAVSYFKKAIELNPGNYDVYNSLGLFYQKIGDFYQSIAIYKRAINIFPSQPWLYYNLGRAYSDITDYRQSVVIYKKFIELLPDYAQGYNNLGVIYASLCRNKEAITSFSKALEINPNLAVAHSNLADIYYYRQQYEPALIHCDKALALGYEVPGKLLEQLKKYRKKNY